jgi:exosortase A-associated hydrolase 2
VVSAFLLPAEAGHRFCVYHPGARASAGLGIVYAHPFCEEMNKSRRMAALQSRRLSAAGHSVLQIDLFGCGDSSGDFADARWGIWKRDLQVALDWLRPRVRGALGLWGLRLGATLAVDVARDPGLGVEQLILWQPVANGEQHLAQFLRLQLAAEMLAEGAAKSGTRELREALAQGTTLEIAGYDLSPRLAAEIDAAALADPAPAVKRVHCLEVVATTEARLSPASQRAVDSWRLKGLDVRAAAVKGDAFWSSIEITECEALLEATEASLEGVS